MSDLIEKIRKEQADLSKKFTGRLVKEFKPYIDTGKLSALEWYVRGSFEDVHGEFDRKTILSMVESEFGSSILCSVIGYTDFVLSQIVRSNDYSVPSPTEIPWKAIEEKYDAPTETLRRTVGFMHSRKNLPLLGIVTLGKFHPDKEELREWKELYDWG